MPKVNFFSYRFRDEGAAIAACDLHTHIKHLDWNIDAVIFSPRDHRKNYIKACHPLLAWLYIYLDLAINRLTTKIANGYYTFLSASLPLALLNKAALQCDIIHVHWHHRGFLGPQQLLRLAEKHILLFTIHDYWLFTGGCHYPGKCTQHISYCIACPSIRKYVSSPTYVSLSFKRRILAHPKAYFVFPSEYALNSVANVFPEIKGKSFIIPNPVSVPQSASNPLKLFPKSTNQGPPVIGLQVTNNPRKGDLNALRVLSAINKNLDIKVHLFGEGFKDDPAYLRSLTYYHAGYIHDRVQLTQYYNSIDVFVSAANDETFGLTIAEAQACGAPVVAFNTSAISEVVIHKSTGYLAEPGNLLDLEKGILYCLSSLSELSSEAIRFAHNRFHPQKIAAKYIDLYTHLA